MAKLVNICGVLRYEEALEGKRRNLSPEDVLVATRAKFPVHVSLWDVGASFTFRHHSLPFSASYFTVRLGQFLFRSADDRNDRFMNS